MSYLKLNLSFSVYEFKFYHNEITETTEESWSRTLDYCCIIISPMTPKVDVYIIYSNLNQKKVARAYINFFVRI